MLLEDPEGTKKTIEIVRESACRNNAGVDHDVINFSDKTMSFIEIEIKT